MYCPDLPAGLLQSRSWVYKRCPPCHLNIHYSPRLAPAPPSYSLLLSEGQAPFNVFQILSCNHSQRKDQRLQWSIEHTQNLICRECINVPGARWMVKTFIKWKTTNDFRTEAYVQNAKSCSIERLVDKKAPPFLLGWPDGGSFLYPSEKRSAHPPERSKPTQRCCPCPAPRSGFIRWTHNLQHWHSCPATSLAQTNGSRCRCHSLVEGDLAVRSVSLSSLASGMVTKTRAMLKRCLCSLCQFLLYFYLLFVCSFSSPRKARRCMLQTQRRVSQVSMQHHPRWQWQSGQSHWPGHCMIQVGYKRTGWLLCCFQAWAIVDTSAAM